MVKCNKCNRKYADNIIALYCESCGNALGIRRNDRTEYFKNGSEKYHIELYNDILHEHKTVISRDKYEVEQKANVQIDRWIEKTKRIYEARELANNKQKAVEQADSLTQEAKKQLSDIENILKHTLNINDAVDWNELLDRKNFTVAHPSKTEIVKKKPYAPEKISYPSIPLKEQFQKPMSYFEKFLCLFSPNYKRRKLSEINSWIDDNFNTALEKYQHHCNAIDAQYNSDYLKYQEMLKNYNDDFSKVVSEWESQKSIFLSKQREYNDSIKAKKENYLAHDPEAIRDYCEMVLNNSEYPDFVSKQFELEYNDDKKILIVEYELPDIEKLPDLVEVKYQSSTGEYKYKHLTENIKNKMFDETIYKITLRTVHELFEADVASAIDAIAFNGIIEYIDKATGKENRTCLLSLFVKKSEFMDIDLSKIDPKTCFRSLKGMSSAKLHGLTPVAPIITFDKSDSRIIDSYDVAYAIDESVNLAAMHWQDFEHLIRELFEKEFASSGGDVKVTQASSDGGVDAIVFDPDPIRGGKLVIQAKRYTNTVNLSAIRDLYGTVQAEGANKGILVTTADYGPDAYEFAKDKPLTLLNGSHLLHLLEKHGHKAKINIKEAKAILSENK